MREELTSAQQPITEEMLHKAHHGGYHCCATEPGFPFIHISERFLSILGWTEEEIRTKFDNKYENLIHPDDRVVSDIFLNMADSDSPECMDLIYRLQGKNGYRWISDTTVRVEVEGRPMYQGILSDVTDYIEQRERKEQERESLHSRQLDTLTDRLDTETQYLEALSRGYTAIYHVDLEQDMATPLKLEPTSNAAQLRLQLRRGIPYQALCSTYCSSYLTPSAGKELLHFLSPETMGKALGQTGYCNTRYHCSPDLDGHAHFEVQAIRMNADPEDANIVLAFRPIDEIVSEEQKRQFALNEQLEREQNQREVFRAIGNIYHAILRLDLKNDTYTVISCRDDMWNYYDLRETSAQRVLDKVCEQIVSKNYRKAMRRFYNLKTLPDRLRYQEFVDADCITKVGNWHRVRLIAKRRDDSGEVTHALYVTQIINDEKRYQEQLIAKAEYADQANQSKSSFVSQVAHDIRTPMNSIFGFLEIAESNLDDREKLQYSLEKIRSAGEFLKDLVNDVLDISRMEDGKIQLQPTQVQVTEMLEDFCASMKTAKFGKQQIFCSNIHHICHETIVVDDLHLKQIYTNVLSNAINYTPDGGIVSFSAWQEEIPGSDHVRLIVTIADTGVGMSQEFMKNMFKKFERGTDTRINKVSGYGLGLTIVKKLVDLMGGIIDVHSEVGEGTTFTISLEVPYVKDPVEAEPAQPMDYGAVCAGMHLLVAEDNELNREVISELLAMHGITCECAQDGNICVERFAHAPQGTYDAILMDLQMPVLNGLEATKQIRRLDLPWARKIPIVAMTANAMKADVEKCLEAGMQRHLSKPVDMTQILKTLAEVTVRV